MNLKCVLQNDVTYTGKDLSSMTSSFNGLHMFWKANEN